MSKLDKLLSRNGGKIRESASHRGKPPAMPGLGSVSLPTAGGRDAGVVRSKVAQVIEVSRIERDPLQPREEFDEDALDRLAASLKKQGVLQPIAVRWDEGRGTWVVVVGERRWRAAQRAGLASIPCTVIDREFAPGELLAVQCMENLLREDLKPIEQAKAFRSLMDLNGWSSHQLARELNLSQPSISQAIVLLNLSEPVQDIVDDGRIGATSAYVIAAKIEDPELQSEVAAKVEAEGLGRAATIQVVEEAIQARPEAARKPSKGRGAEVKVAGRKSEARPPKAKEKVIPLRTYQASTGVKLTAERARGVDLPLMLRTLEEVADRVRAEIEAAGQGGEADAA